MSQDSCGSIQVIDSGCSCIAVGTNVVQSWFSNFLMQLVTSGVMLHMIAEIII